MKEKLVLRITENNHALLAIKKEKHTIGFVRGHSLPISHYFWQPEKTTHQCPSDSVSVHKTGCSCSLNPFLFTKCNKYTDFDHITIKNTEYFYCLCKKRDLLISMTTKHSWGTGIVICVVCTVFGAKCAYLYSFVAHSLISYVIYCINAHNLLENIQIKAFKWGCFCIFRSSVIYWLAYNVAFSGWKPLPLL